MSLGGGGWEISEYNGFDQLIKTYKDGVEVDYIYKPDGLRLSKTVDGVKATHVWDGGYTQTPNNGGMVSANIVMELDGNGNVIDKYVYGIGLVKSDNNGYYTFDAHGDVVQTTNSSGTVVKNYSFDSFGNDIGTTQSGGSGSTDGNPFRFAGEYFDVESGTYYLRARYYQPATGRFLTEDTHWSPSNMIYGDNPVKWNERIADPNDPLGLNAYTYVPDIHAIMQSGNLYVYCMHNPLTYIDSSGNFAITLTAVGAAALYGLLAAGVAYSTYKIAEIAIPEIYNAVKNSKSKAALRSLNNLAGYVGAPMPLPPNDPKSSGTNTGGSKTLYNKNGVRVDVENVGSNVGRVHIQTGGGKYYYNHNTMQFYSDKASTVLAPKAVQNLLTNKDVISAIIKGLKVLGF